MSILQSLKSKIYGKRLQTIIVTVNDKSTYRKETCQLYFLLAYKFDIALWKKVHGVLERNIFLLEWQGFINFDIWFLCLDC